ncbi:hypothetical protein DY000_02053447 [Brassica cretica]|uniref:Uncharacterized protein n=1 Tax=Brassica cretica TaxID=69181 RepID=A0ABQ7ALM5_BRACR|nr:hypothetical protein DY000_02053447 [Brassica cretica]
MHGFVSYRLFGKVRSLCSDRAVYVLGRYVATELGWTSVATRSLRGLIQNQCGVSCGTIACSDVTEGNETQKPAHEAQTAFLEPLSFPSPTWSGLPKANQKIVPVAPLRWDFGAQIDLNGLLMEEWMKFPSMRPSWWRVLEEEHIL